MPKIFADSPWSVQFEQRQGKRTYGSALDAQYNGHHGRRHPSEPSASPPPLRRLVVDAGAPPLPIPPPPWRRRPAHAPHGNPRCHPSEPSPIPPLPPGCLLKNCASAQKLRICLLKICASPPPSVADHGRTGGAQDILPDHWTY